MNAVIHMRHRQPSAVDGCAPDHQVEHGQRIRPARHGNDHGAVGRSESVELVGRALDQRQHQ
jgi:hypothetical protein